MAKSIDISTWPRASTDTRGLGEKKRKRIVGRGGDKRRVEGENK
jgi:hypothetical protein